MDTKRLDVFIELTTAARQQQPSGTLYKDIHIVSQQMLMRST